MVQGLSKGDQPERIAGPSQGKLGCMEPRRSFVNTDTSYKRIQIWIIGSEHDCSLNQLLVSSWSNLTDLRGNGGWGCSRGQTLVKYPECIGPPKTFSLPYSMAVTLMVGPWVNGKCIKCRLQDGYITLNLYLTGVLFMARFQFLSLALFAW